ncbi:permease [Patescibacteria group bacterium]|nr:permease [Patescibacteria group bacterium]MBU1934970.1 permease [Patescibacteria group bacterium]
MFQYIADIITYNLFDLAEGSQIALATNFFFYDVLKILFLIFTVVTVIAFIRSFFDPNKFKKPMTGLKWGGGNVAAALFGAVTPFCSCSSIPLFIGFIESRFPLGIAFSFLITSPLVNEVAFVIMGGLFGWKLAFLYALSGIALGVFGGLIIGSLKMEKEIILENKEGEKYESVMPKKLEAKIKFAFNFGWWTFKRLLPYVIGGIAIGAVIHGYVPQEFFVNTIGKFEVLSVPVAALVGIPIYAGCSTLVPIIFSITTGGVPLGTALAFMMAIAGLSLPEAVMLKRILSLKLLATFFGLVAIGIVIIGYLFNFLS